MEMPDLRNVLSAILVDLTMAQHHANRMTRRLAKRYRQDAILQHLPAPNAVVDEVEMTLRYAVESVDTEGEEQPAPSEVHEFTPNRAHTGRLANRIASLVAGGLAEEVRSTSDADHPHREQLLASLALPSTREALAARIGAALHEVWGSRWGAGQPDAGDDLISRGIDAIAQSLTEALQGDEHLRSAVGPVKPVIDRAIGRLRETLAEQLAAARMHPLLTVGGLGERTAIRVILDGTRLANLPEQAVQTLTIKLDLRGYRSVPESEDCHTPTSRRPASSSAT